MFIEGKSRTVFFPQTLNIYGICRDGTKMFNIRACEHMILGRLRTGASFAIYVALGGEMQFQCLDRHVVVGNIRSCEIARLRVARSMTLMARGWREAWDGNILDKI